MQAKVLKVVGGFFLADVIIVLLAAGFYFFTQRASIKCWEKVMPGFRMGYSVRLDIPRPDDQLDQHAACMGTERTTRYYAIIHGIDEMSYLYASRKLYGY